MNFIIVDLEATCLEVKPVDYISEIIEIGAVKVDEKGNILDTFDVFVKPTINPILSDFCKELTTITQEEVDNGLDKETALREFKNFCGSNCMLLSWGAYDKNQLRKDFADVGLSTFILNNHHNLKVEFSRILGCKKQYGMAKALRIANIDLDGTHHRGIDDAKNIAKIFQKYINKWTFFEH